MKKRKITTLDLPLTKSGVLALKAGDMVLVNGMIVTGRDKLHRYLFNERPPQGDIPFDLKGAILYHCGPIVKRVSQGFRLVAGGPTTSMRVELYEPWIIQKYKLRGIMGKGGMGNQTLHALKQYGCVYLHAIGGAAAYLAGRIKQVTGVWKLEEFGMTEAMWILEVQHFPALVTMDAHGRSLHEEIERVSAKEFKKLIM